MGKRVGTIGERPVAGRPRRGLVERSFFMARVCGTQAEGFNQRSVLRKHTGKGCRRGTLCLSVTHGLVDRRSTLCMSVT